MESDQEYFAVTARGIEPATAAELNRLGATNVRPVAGGVQFEADRALLYRACLWLRTPSRILKPLRDFAAATAEMLYSQTRRVRWEDYLDPAKTFAVQATIEGSAARRQQQVQSSASGNAGGPRDKAQRVPQKGIHHSLFAALKIKDAIVDRLRREQGARPNVDRENPDILVHAHFAQGRCTLSLDAIGSSLHERRYRTEPAAAPLKENLAAAILELIGWQGESPLYDPMCGSGTIVIEAALKALGIAPGLRRERFACQRWPDFDGVLWQQAVDEARRQERQNAPHAIVGTDADPAAIRTALSHARRAGVAHAVRFEVRPLDEARPPADTPGVIVTNPPYGERLGDEPGLADLYRRLGEIIPERFPGWRAWVLTGNLSLARQIGLSATGKFKLYNGPIPCRLLGFDG